MATFSSSTGMQKPIASVLFDLSVATPITRPAESKTGPPELPGVDRDVHLIIIHPLDHGLRAHHAAADRVFQHDVVAQPGIADDRDVLPFLKGIVGRQLEHR